MAIELKMPALSPTMEEGTLARWLVKVGDTIRSGDIMAEIETDKATMEFEAVDEGVLAAIVVGDGTENVAVGTVIAMLAEEGEDVGDVSAPSAKAAPAPAVYQAAAVAAAPSRKRPPVFIADVVVQRQRAMFIAQARRKKLRRAEAIARRRGALDIDEEDEG